MDFDAVSTPVTFEHRISRIWASENFGTSQPTGVTPKLCSLSAMPRIQELMPSFCVILLSQILMTKVIIIMIMIMIKIKI